jgi:hypothetical protein
MLIGIGAGGITALLILKFKGRPGKNYGDVTKLVRQYKRIQSATNATTRK